VVWDNERFLGFVIAADKICHHVSGTLGVLVFAAELQRRVYAGFMFHWTYPRISSED
jgi:hypothetical protein